MAPLQVTYNRHYMSPVGKTIQVASDREHDSTKVVLPAEIARGVYIQNPPSVEALKLMHFLIAEAGGRMAEEVSHHFKLSDLVNTKGIRRHTRKTLEPLFQELAACVLTIDDTDAQKVRIGGFLDEAEIDYSNEGTGDLRLTWWFRRTFRKLAGDSNYWTILDRQTVYALTSKYSILLFQHFSSLQNLEHKTSETFTIEQLRGILGVAEGKLKRFADLHRRALQPALDEINQLSRFTLTAKPHKTGRSITSIEISWKAKADPYTTKKELDSHSTGRKARRTRTAEQVAERRPAFPATGSISFTAPWKTIARTHGNGKDIDLIATDFRIWCASGGIPLDKAGIEKTFTGFCKRCKI